MTDTDRLLAEAIDAARAGDLDGAVEALEKCVDAAPACRRAWALLGAIHRKRGDEGLARAALREAGAEGLVADDLTLLAGEGSAPAADVVHAEPDGAGLRLIDEKLLLVPAGETSYARARGSVLHSGALAFEVAVRRRKGSAEGDAFVDDGGPVYRLRGHGMVLLRAGRGRYTVLDVGDSPLFAREMAVEAFEGALVFENGHLPGRTAATRPAFVEFQGRGRVAVFTRGRPVAVPVTEERPARAAVAALVGWFGRVVPIVEEQGGGAEPAIATCEGQGSLLLDPAELQEE